MRRAGVVLVLLLLQGLLFSKAKLPKFGKVDPAVLQMDIFPEDSTADAVILFHVGDLRILDDGTVRCKQRKRIKILTEKGKEDYTTIRIAYSRGNRIKGLKGVTMLPDGRIVKLARKDIHEESLGTLKTKIFAFPGAEVGCVLEYQFELESSNYIFLEPWYFQNRLYTQYSRISVVIPSAYSYFAFLSNTQDMASEKDHFASPRGKNKVYSWKMENLPPVREEPFMRTMKDYLASIHFQLVSYRGVTLVEDWRTLVQNSYEHYRPFLRWNRNVYRQLHSLLPADGGRAAKLRTLYEYVRDSIATTSHSFGGVNRKPEQVLKDRKGNSAEKNMLLLNLLNTAGFEAYPLLISTRGHGRLHREIPRLTQFDHMLAYVQDGEETFVFDTRDANCPFNLLPVDDLVETGLVIEELQEGEGERFVELPLPRSVNNIRCDTAAKIEESGDLRNRSMIRMEGYRAMDARRAIRKDGATNYIKTVLKEPFGEVIIDSFYVKDLDSPDMPLGLVVHFTVPAYAQIAGEKLYLRAPFIQQVSTNPLKARERSFPVEFEYSIASSDLVTLSIPEGYTIEEYPQNVFVHDDRLRFITQWQETSSGIIIERQYMCRQLLFTPQEYKPLRHFFDRIVVADQGQLVVSRSDSALTE